MSCRHRLDPRLRGDGNRLTRFQLVRMKRLFDWLERFDWILLMSALALCAIGLVALFGIGVSLDPPELFTFHKQLVAAGLGCALVLGIALFDYRHLRTVSLPLYLVGIVLLTLVMFFGQSVRSTQGWFRFGNLSFQPVEISKLLLVIYLASLFARFGHGRLTWKTFGLTGTATGLYVFLVMFQPDFGSAMVMIAAWGCMCLFIGLPRKAWIILPTIVMLITGLTWSIGLKPYQKARIATFLHPELDARGDGYNATQARIAIGSGGFLGKGIGEGSQARLRFLPEAATDFLFAVLGEELGFLGVTVVISLFFLLLYRYMRIAFESENDFAALLLIGLSAIFLVHLLVNAGMNLGIMPITGIPLPFISAAASSVVVAFCSVGIAESVAARRRGQN